MKTVDHYTHTPAPAPCECESHPDGANFYVSVKDGSRSNVLAGPYSTHPEALAHVEQIRAWAERVNDRAVFYAFGTVAMAPDFNRPGMANQHINVYA